MVHQYRQNPVPYPASGAWFPGDPVGRRKFHTFATDRPFSLEGGGSLRDVTIAYETWGVLNRDASNAVLVCHAWTGDSHVSSAGEQAMLSPGWWDGVVGPGLAIDTNRYFVVCSNVLGGCQGSTGPASAHPDDARPYGLRFPVVTIRDMVRAQAQLADHLGVRRWHSVVGGSMGGMQALEWAIIMPERVGSLVAIATCAESTAQQIAWTSIGRRVLVNDPAYNNGDYYDAEPDGGPWLGLSMARMIAQVTFRTDTKFSDKFGRETPGERGLIDESDLFSMFSVESYLDHHGDKLVRRFDANSYLYIGKAMDLHDIGRGRGGVARALARITAPTLTLSIDSDILYPPYQQEAIQAQIVNGDPRNTHGSIVSVEGHDGFLIEVAAVGANIRAFFETLDVTG
jgi:homoserine O-acetyltransferase